MKVALCLSGFARTMQYSYPYLEKYLLNHLQPDIFFFGYTDNDNGVTEDSIIDTYSPVKYCCREFTEAVEEEIWDSYGSRDVINTQLHPSSSPIYMLSQWYNIFKSNELKCKQEQEKGFIYDIVVRARTDYYFFRKLEDYELNLANSKMTVCTPDVWDFKIVNPHAVTDFFAFGDSNSMNIYSNLFNRAAEYNLKHKFIFHPESMTGYNLHVENVNREVVKNNFWLELDDFWKNPDEDVTHCYIEGLTTSPTRKNFK